MWLLKPEPGVCQECAHDHTPDLPHDATSLYFQYAFWSKEGRWPTWEDAWAHCTPEMIAFWKAELTEMGVDLAAGRLRP